MNLFTKKKENFWGLSLMLTWFVAFCAAINKVSAKIKSRKAIFSNSTHDSANGSMIELNIETYDQHNGCVGG